MAGNDSAASLQGCALRVTRLDAAGATPAGASGMIVTGEFISVEFKAVLETGDEFSVKNACGGISLTYKDSDKLKRYDVTLTTPNSDVELEELLTGATLITDDGDTIGISAPAVGAPPSDGVCLEIWTKAWVGGGPAAALPYWRYVVPHWSPAPGDFKIEGAPMQPGFTGPTWENNNIGNGPNNDWPDGLVDTAGRSYSRFRDTALPAFAAGYQPTPVQVP